ncbi:hypothetical protein [Deinococcus sp. S9]|uniref:hypothetical protein n=1 Tax=Deinococcus sp. S9 TaxID=2545754 RepID=UPI0010562135|nr:hypothetical protein [Deinococcus sp. S9]TDE87387.1 hypothetical protein E0686_02525 [Deinococcus sp. S9]
MASRRSAGVLPATEGGSRFDAHLEAALRLLPDHLLDEGALERASAWLREMRKAHPQWLLRERPDKLATLAKLHAQRN